jgi:hypothetical protein
MVPVHAGLGDEYRIAAAEPEKLSVKSGAAPSQPPPDRLIAAGMRLK